LATPQKI